MDSIFNLAVIIRAVDQLTGPAREMANAITNLDGMAARGQAMMDWGTRASAAGALTEMAAGKIMSALNGPIDAAAQFEESMALVRAVTANITGEEFAALTAQARELGASTAFSASQAAEGMAFLAKAGFTAREQLAAMPSMLALARAGSTDLGQAADIASNILSGFGLEAEEMARVADVMVATFTTANTDIPMLGETMKYIAPVARAAGMSFEEAAAMAGLLGNAGIQASQAGTTLRSMLTRLAAPGGEAAKTLDALGISVSDADGNMRNIVELIGDVGSAIENLGTAEQLQIIGTVFGRQAAAGAAEMLAQGTSIAEYVEQLSNSGGRAAQVASDMGDNLRGARVEFTSAIEGLNISLGTILLPTMTEIARTATRVVQNLMSWAEANPGIAETAMKMALVGGMALSIVAPILSIIGGFWTMAGAGLVALSRLGMLFIWLVPKIVAASAAVLGLAYRLVLAAASAVPAMLSGLASMGAALGGSILAGLRAVTMAARAMGLAFLMNPVVLIAVAIAGAAFLIWQYWEPISAFFVSLWGDVQTVFEGFSTWLSGWWETLTGWFGEGFDWSGMIPDIDWAALVPPLEWSTVFTVLDWATWLLPIRWLDFIPGFSWAEIFAGIAAFEWSSLIPDLDWSAIIPAAPDIDWSSVTDAIAVPFTMAFDLVDAVWGRLQSLFEWSPIEAITGAFGGIGETLVGFISDAADMAGAAWNRVTSLFSSSDAVDLAARDPASIERATRAAHELAEALEGVAGLDLSSAQAGVNAVTEAAAQAIASAGGIPRAANDAIRAARSIVAQASFHNEGVALMATLAAGIRAGASQAVAAVRETVQVMRDHLPHSPAKVGPLSDLHRVRFAETLAEAVRPAPAIEAVQRLAAGMAAALAGATLSLPAAAAQLPSIPAAAIAMPQVGVSQADGGLGAGGGIGAAQPGVQVSIDFSPNITMQGGGGGDGGSAQSREQMRELLRSMSYELVQLVEDELKRRQRQEY
ncbi:MAG: phage tail tape measure protein [Pigmentiphaga sp.]|nr:phage tail tape measure protein [Pigmentiphaga sp.]